MSQRRKVFSPAVQDLFGGDGMVEDSGPPTLEEWERIVRQVDDNLSAYVGDRKKARRILSMRLSRESGAFLKPRWWGSGSGGAHRVTAGEWLAKTRGCPGFTK